MTRAITRRSLVAATGMGLLVPAARVLAAGTVGFSDGATLMVAGPGGGPLDAWAEWLAPALSQALPPGTALRKDVVGGADGVTGANQFEALTVPDGSTALLLPGRAAMAWLVGDPRARFDAARWVPALAAVSPGVLMSRLAATQLQTGAELRIAVSDPAGPELPALLALDMLGARWRPVFGLSEALGFEALGQHEVDAVYLSGRRVAKMVESCAAAGVQPLFQLGSVDEAGARRSDAVAEVPDVSELLAGRNVDAGLRRALRATSAASELDMALVLPQLTPAGMVALWRRACAQAAVSDAVQMQATAQGVRPLPAPAATASTAAVLADTTTLLTLRQWLAVRLNYRPS